MERMFEFVNKFWKLGTFFQSQVFYKHERFLNICEEIYKEEHFWIYKQMSENWTILKQHFGQQGHMFCTCKQKLSKSERYDHYWNLCTKLKSGIFFGVMNIFWKANIFLEIQNIFRNRNFFKIYELFIKGEHFNKICEQFVKKIMIFLELLNKIL